MVLAQPARHGSGPELRKNCARRRKVKQAFLFILPKSSGRLPDAFGVVYIEGTSHYDFSDLPLLSPLAPQLGLKGPINGKRVTVILEDYLLSFFDATLKGKPSGLFEDPSPYEEVKPK